MTLQESVYFFLIHQTPMEKCHPHGCCSHLSFNTSANTTHFLFRFQSDERIINTFKNDKNNTFNAEHAFQRRVFFPSCYPTMSMASTTLPLHLLSALIASFRPTRALSTTWLMSSLDRSPSTSRCSPNACKFD